MADNPLEQFVNAVSGDSPLAVEENLGDGFVRLRVAEAERRQAKHDIRAVEDLVIEMLRNSRDAHARNVYVAVSREGDMRRVVVLDDGDGVPPQLHDRVFEPRVTSKLETMVVDTWGVHGRGMALYSIRANASSARIAASDLGLGASFEVTVDLASLPERADQSTLPQVARDDSGALFVERGPHNILRTIVEFALDSIDGVSVYAGSPTDIVATLHAHGERSLSDEQLLFCDDVSSLPVCQRIAAAADASDLVGICEGVGLPVSERTAHRVLARQIPPLDPLLDRVLPSASAPKSPDIYRDSRGLKISAGDLAQFTSSLEDAFSVLAERYFITLTDTPKVRIGKDSLSVKFPIEKEL